MWSVKLFPVTQFKRLFFVLPSRPTCPFANFNFQFACKLYFIVMYSATFRDCHDRRHQTTKTYYYYDKNKKKKQYKRDCFCLDHHSSTCRFQQAIFTTRSRVKVMYIMTPYLVISSGHANTTHIHTRYAFI